MGREPVKRPGQKLSSFWQPGFHDRLLRSDESYAAKWDYVFQNPVRAGLISRAEDCHMPARSCESIERKKSLGSVASAVFGG